MKWVLRILGLCLFVLIIVFLNIDIGGIFRIIASSNIVYIILALSLLIPMYIIKAWKWQGLIRMQGTDYPLRQSIAVYWIGLFIGILTPGRLGDFIKIFYLKRDKNLSLGRSFSTVFLDRLSDVILLLCVALFGMYFFAYFFEKQLIVLSLITIAVVFAAVFLFSRKGIIRRLVHKLCDISIPRKYRKLVKNGFADIYRSIKSMGIRDFAFMTLLTLFYWSIFFVQMHLLALALNIDISLFYSTICVSISTIFTMLPVSISGIGTRDAVFILIFSVLGLPREAAIGFSLMILFIYVFTGFIGMLFWLKKPIRIGTVLGHLKANGRLSHSSQT